MSEEENPSLGRLRSFGFRRNVQRPDSGAEAHRVTFVELFFDLVFVFAITQISHALILKPDLPTVLQAVILTVAVWWVWVDTTWVTNWLHPEDGRVRGMLIVLMLLGLLMSTALPYAFGKRALVFALCLVAIQVGRSLFTMAALRRQDQANFLNFARITTWVSVSGAFWVGGALAPEQWRLPIWLIALAIDTAGPLARFFTPGLGATPTGVWTVSGEHIAERAGLFIILALGESIIVTGTSFGSLEFTPVTILAFLAAFTSTVLMWLLYFNHGESRGSEYIAGVEETGPVARLAYTYLHILLVLGVVLTAVADGLVLVAPLGAAEQDIAAGKAPTDLWLAVLISASAALYLVGNALFKRAVGAPILLSHYVGVAVLALIVVVSPQLNPLAVSWLSNAVLLAVVFADERVFRRRHRPDADDADRDAEVAL